MAGGSATRSARRQHWHPARFPTSGALGLGVHLGVVDRAIRGGLIHILRKLAALEAHALEHEPADARAQLVEVCPGGPAAPLWPNRPDPPLRPGGSTGTRGTRSSRDALGTWGSWLTRGSRGAGGTRAPRDAWEVGGGRQGRGRRRLREITWLL